jgi:hypothetical protein
MNTSENVRGGYYQAVRKSVNRMVEKSGLGWQVVVDDQTQKIGGV